MIINKLEIINFGKFKNKTIEFCDGFNVVLGNNEAGKSTVIDFIYAMLYGFGEKRGTLPLREKYIPWDSSYCEGKIFLTLDDGEKIFVYRRTGETKKSDIFKVFDEVTGTELNISEDKIAPISAGAFLRTLCIKQLSSVIDGSDEDIMQRLSDMAVSGEDGISCDKAIKILKDYKRELAPRGGGGVLGELKRKYEELLVKNEKEEEKRKSQYITQNKLKAEKDILKKAQTEYENFKESNVIYEIADIKARIDEKQKQLDALSKEKPKNLKPLFIGLAVFFGIYSFIHYAFLFITAVSVLFAVFLKPKSNTSERETLFSEIDKLEESLVLLEENAQKSENTKKLLFERYSFSQREVYRLEAYLNELNREEDDTCVKDELLNADTELYMAQKMLSAVNVSIESLEKAKEYMHKSFTPKLNTIASKYLALLTNSKYENLSADENFNILITSTIPRKGELFSGGTIDQMHFSLRLAIIDMLFGNDKIFLILDQPFMQYDEERKSSALNLLKEISPNRQILLFGEKCKEADCELNL